jgi:hypothetical protein
MNESVLPTRSGSRPSTIPTNPHIQLEQNPQSEMVEELARRVSTLPGVEERPSAIPVPGARALLSRGRQKTLALFRLSLGACFSGVSRTVQAVKKPLLPERDRLGGDCRPR